MIAKTIQQLTYWPIYLTLKLIFKYKIEGQENLKGLEKKSVIFASNHGSYIDGPICAASMPRGSLTPKDFFPIRFLALKKFFNFKTNSFPFPLSIFTTLYVRYNGSIPVEKGMGDLSIALSEPIRELKTNNIKLWIYPEGYITKDGNLQKGKRGITFLHQSTGVPIVPVYITGNFGIELFKNLPRYLFGFKKLKIKIGKPIYSLGDVSLEDGAEKVMKEISTLIEK